MGKIALMSGVAAIAMAVGAQAANAEDQTISAADHLVALVGVRDSVYVSPAGRIDVAGPATALVGGGIFVWFSIGIPPITYIQRLNEVTPITDLWVGLIKAPVFGFIIALAGCFQGMLVQGNSEEVGSRTTNAVVQSIFLVIVLDAVFAVFFSSIGWV